MASLSFKRTRIAPTPSGYLHTGNAMSFLITASLAKQADAKLLLRIDDLDRERARKEYVEDIFETLHFLGIAWEEGPKDSIDFEESYSQVHRVKLYENALEQLRYEGHVFACICSRTHLQNGGECNCRDKKISLDDSSASWRLITDEQLALSVLTTDGERIKTYLPSAMKSFVVRKKNGYPSYQLSSLADDEYFGVDAIVRGLDLWESTLAQQYLALTLRKPFFSDVVFYHHPLVMNAKGDDKLSKSAGAASIRFLRSEGKKREDVIKMIETLLTV